jgi:hypothetical protein
MKTPAIFLAVIAAIVSSQSQAVTYAGQDCVGRSGDTLTYDATGAINNTKSIYISCPLVHQKDGGTAAAAAVIYFTGAATKSCFFDNFNIDTGGLWRWTSASATTRMVLPTLTPTKAWSPYALNCYLPQSNKVTGYYIHEL